MSRRFVAKVVAVAIAITAIGNAPAKANEDLAAALATVVGVAILGGIINQQIDNDDDISRATRNIYDRTYYSNGYATQPRFNTTARARSRALPRGTRRAFLPADCLLRFNDRRVFGKRCLKKKYKYTSSLPNQCEVLLRANGKKNKGYNARCLRRAGYGLALR